jgi:hypothetical protein
MCTACDFEDNVPAAHAVAPAEVAAAVRRLEGELLDEPAGDLMWSIFFGRESGSIPWGLFERMRACHEAALSLLAAEAVAKGAQYRLRPIARRTRAGRVCAP